MSQVSVELRAMADAVFSTLSNGDLDAFVALTARDVEFRSMLAEGEGTTSVAMPACVPGGRPYGAPFFRTEPEAREAVGLSA